MNLRERLASGTLLLDGATGTVLRARGLPADRVSSVWTIERPDEVERLARAYVDAGAGLILANTFCAAPGFVAPFGCDSRHVIERAIAIARRAAGDSALVGASLSTASPVGNGAEAAMIEYERQVEVFCQSGVDVVVVETMTSIEDLQKAVRAANAVRGSTPIVACMSFNSDLRAADGTLPEELAWVVEDLDCDVVGVNCCDGPETVRRVVEAMARATELPIWAKPNAGLSTEAMDDADFAAAAVQIVSAGATAIGGCCGTTPDTIRAIAARLDAR